MSLLRKWVRGVALAAMLLLAGWPTAARAYCVNPSGIAGDTMYSHDWRTEQYCNNFQWMPMGRPLYTPQGVTFDGSTNYLSDTTTLGAADGAAFTGSFWFRRSGGYGSNQAILVSGSGVGNVRFEIFFFTSNKIIIEGGATSNSDLLQVTEGTAITDANWHHLMFSFDLTNAAHHSVYLDGVAQTLTGLPYTNGNIVFSGADTNIGTTLSGASKFQGDLADFWFDEDYYLDLSQAANRAYFIDSTLNPVYLGTDGSKGPTGAAPTVFLSGAVSAWQTNKGSGGGFTTHGTLTDADPITTGDIATGLAGWWTLDDGSGTSAVDSSGNGNTGTLNNAPTWATGQDGGALTFDGATQNVTVPDVAALQLSGSWTVSTWVNLSALPTSGNFYGLFTKTTAASYANYTFHLANVSGVQTWEALFSDSAGYQLATAALPVSTGTWYLVTGVWDSSTNNLYLYVNGALQATTNTGANIPGTGSGNPFTFGSGQATGYMPGTLDDVRVYSRALSAADIRKLYNLGFYTCANPSDHRGDLVYNGSTHHVLQYCDGAVWRAAGPNPGTGGGGCSNPAGSEGHILYNGDYSVMQYCDGAVWRQIGGIPPTPTASGLIHEWKLDEAPGATTAVDSVNAINMTTKTGTVDFTASGKDNNGLNFPNDGTVKAFSRTIPADMRNISAITLSMWFKLANASTSYLTFGSQDGTTNLGPEVFGSGTSHPNQIYFNLDNAGSASVYAAWSPDTNWHHVVLVFDGTQATQANRLKGYLDGAQLTLTAFSGTIPTTTGNTAATFYFGEISGGEISAGSMDDVRVYNRALSAQEVRDLYNGT